MITTIAEALADSPDQTYLVEGQIVTYDRQPAEIVTINYNNPVCTRCGQDHLTYALVAVETGLHTGARVPECQITR